MIVWLSDLRSNLASWAAVALTMVCAACGTTLALTMLSGNGEASQAIGGTVLSMAIISTILITIAQLRLIIEEHETTYRSWRSIGMPGALLCTFVITQVLVVSLAGALVGVFVARPLIGPAVATLIEDGVPIDNVSLTAAIAQGSVTVCVLSALFGSLLPLRRIFHPRSRPHPGWLIVRVTVGVAAISATIYPAFAAMKRPDDLAGLAMGIVAVIALFLSWILPLVDQWTRTLGIAGANVRVRRQFSAPQIVPWFLSIAMIVTMGSVIRILREATPGPTTVSPPEVLAVVLGPAVLPALVGALGISVIMRHRIAADVRGLRLAGAPRFTWVRVQFTEALALSGTMGLLTLLSSGVSTAAMNHLVFRTSSLHGLWWEALVVASATMVTLTSGVKLWCGARARS